MSSIILASGSPRRKEILTEYGFDYEVIKPIRDEISVTSSMSPEDIATLNAKNKALEIYETHKDKAILAADTIVCLETDNKTLVLGKPLDYDDAVRILELLQGKTHYVLTGICIIKNNNVKVLFDKSYVTFYKMSTDDIKKYIVTIYIMDKAGAYSIDDDYTIGHVIEKYEGSFNNIKGLPIEIILPELEEFKNK